MSLEKFMKTMTVNWRETIFSSPKPVAAFADDADLIDRVTVHIKRKFVELDKESNLIRLNGNEEIIKYLALDKNHGFRVGQNIRID